MPEVPGLLLFKPGHVGVYIGAKKVVEAKGHAYGVVETNLADGNWQTWGMLKWIDYSDNTAVKLFKDGEEKEAIEYLIETGRLDKDKKEHWIHSTELILYQKWIFIEWANDVKQITAYNK